MSHGRLIFLTQRLFLFIVNQQKPTRGNIAICQNYNIEFKQFLKLSRVIACVQISDI